MTATGPGVAGQPPSLRLRRLAAELRTLRQAAQLSREVAAQRTALNSATLWRIETARARPQQRTLLALMDLYGLLDQDRRTELISLARSAAPPAGGSAPGDGSPPHGYGAQVDFEAKACRVRRFESRVVPDLLQTERYARAALTGLNPDAGPDELEQLVTLWRRRQGILRADPPVEVDIVVDESALHRRVGGDQVHQDQLRQLAQLARLRQITIRVLPYHAGAHVGLHGGFTILDFPDPARAGLVCVETVAGVSPVEGEDELASYLDRFERLRSAAFDPGRSLSALARLAGDPGAHGTEGPDR